LFFQKILKDAEPPPRKKSVHPNARLLRFTTPSGPVKKRARSKGGQLEDKVKREPLEMRVSTEHQNKFQKVLPGVGMIR